MTGSGRAAPGGTKSALVTGASRGIGRAIAMSLAAQGFGLTITSRRVQDLEELAPVLTASGSPRVVHFAADMADLSVIPELVALHKRTHASMAVLVVNAGVGTAGDIASFPMSRLVKSLDVNFIAPFTLIQASLPLLRIGASENTNGAKVIALSSITGVYAEPGLAAYGASKAAMLSLIETLNREEAHHGVTASAVAPGYVATDMSSWVMDRIPAAEMIPVADVVSIVDTLIGLSRNCAVPKVVLARSTGTGYEA